MVEMPRKVKQKAGPFQSEITRVYVMYSNGYIRGESGGKWVSGRSFQQSSPSQYVIAKYDPIQTEADIVKMVNRLDQVLTANTKLMQDYDKWKAILAKDPERYKDCPSSVLNLIDSQKHSQKDKEIMDKYKQIFQKNPTFTTTIPLYYLERIDFETAKKKEWYLKVKKNFAEIENVPEKYLNEIIAATHPKLKQIANIGIFDKN